MNNDEATPVVADTNEIQLHELHVEGNHGQLKNHEERSGQSPAPQEKVYYFGCGSCHPRWLQYLANGKFYTFILSLFVIVEGSIVSGKVYYNTDDALAMWARLFDDCYLLHACRPPFNSPVVY